MKCLGAGLTYQGPWASDNVGAVESKETVEMLVRRGDIRDVRFETALSKGDIELSQNQVLLRIDKFGFTSNNVTYATLGEVMRYWDFFPAPKGWGRVPV